MTSANKLCLIDTSICDLLKKKNIDNFMIFSDFDINGEECEKLSNYGGKLYKYDTKYLKNYSKMIDNMPNTKRASFNKELHFLPKELSDVIYKFYEEEYIYAIFHYCKYDNQIIRNKLIKQFLYYKESLRNIMTVVIIQDNLLVPYDIFNKWYSPDNFQMLL